MSNEHIGESFLAELIKWQQGGRREISIKIGNLNYNQETKAEIQLYDSVSGWIGYPASIEDIPNDMKNAARERILKDIAYYQRRLEELDGEEASG